MSLYDDYLLAKSRHPGKVVLLTDGSGFYRTHGADVHLVVRASGLTATDGCVRLPRTLLEATLHHLLRAGEQVALCEPVVEKEGGAPYFLP